MYRCMACGKLYVSQREADLCTPEDYWMDVYGSDTADPFGYLR